MTSPFPGMDPWLEDPEIFPDLHDTLVTRLGDVINPQLPEPYYASSARRVWIDYSYRQIGPDVNVLYPQTVKPKPGSMKKKQRSNGIALVEPKRLHVPAIIENDETSEPYLEIYAILDTVQLVTTIEVLSPSNKKPGMKGRELYLKKQNELLHRRVNLVEIDLLRGGVHTSAMPRDLAEQEFGKFDYHISIRPMDEPDDYLVYLWKLEERLPAFRVPLLPGHEAVTVNLQELLDECYDRRNYDRRARYRATKAKPPLTKKQMEWAEQLFKAGKV